MLFSRPSRAVGIDIGTHSVKAVQLSKSGGDLRVDHVGYAVVDRNQANVDIVAAQVEALREALRPIPLAQSLLVGALPGQTVVIRYPRLPEMAEAELSQAIEKEASQNLPFELSEVLLDWTVLDTMTEGDKKFIKLLLVAAKHEVVASRVQMADAAEIKLGILGVDSLAMADAAEGCGLLREAESVALVNIGASSTSIHFLKDGISNFIRDINWGGRELIQAIAKGARCEFAEAERRLIDYAAGKRETPPPSLPSSHTEAPPPKPPASGSLLDPLDDELGDLGGEPLARKSVAPAAEGSKELTQFLTTPLSRLVSEIRRSFDFYEQQMYEQPVGRLVLSGGVAQLPLVRETLAEELGLEHVEVADPSAGVLVVGGAIGVEELKARAPQFMVAVGLAVRGADDL